MSIEELRAARAGPSRYASPSLRDFVARAAEANRVLPELLESYRSGVESEIALVQGESDGREVVLQVEQVASELAWRSDRPPVQRVVGYRSRTLGLVPSLLGMFQVPWVVPTLYGESIDLVRWSAPTVTDDGRVLRRRAAHPLGPERERFYRFDGGDTVLVLRLPDRTIPLVRVEVRPVASPDRPTLLFEGYLDIDATRHQIVRMRGRMIASDPDPSLDERLLGAAFTGATFVDFESAEYDGRFWLPRHQRIEVQAVSRLTDTRMALRVVSRFRFPEPNPDPPVTLPADVPAGGLLEVGDVFEGEGFEGWSTAIGTLSGSVGVHDFRDLEPARAVPGAGPRLRFGLRHLSQLVRYNPAEGLFTGVGGVLEGGPLPDDVRVRGHGGWAWAESTARGGAEISWVPGGGREWALRAERQIVSMDDFGGAYGREPGVAPVVAGDEQVFHDHRTLGLVARLPGPVGVWRLEVARGADRSAGSLAVLGAPPADTASDPADPALAAAVAEGDYWIGRVTLERHGGATGFGVGTGASLRLHGEAATGELDWARLEGGLRMGRVLGRVSIDGRLDGGVVFSADPPPQRLFELGRYSGLPGYAARAFAGDRALVGQAAVGYTLPILRRPLGGGAFLLPAVAPAPTVIVRSGWTDASDDARVVLERIGAVTSGGFRSTLDLRLRLFGGGVSLGFARPLDTGGEWRFVWSLVAEF
ncbi:MAG: hypothetical protein KY453_07035 [Gemmatimonadetes bacterium]|nr:hypothetical protein [Gemmatimonadota bacterium]